MSYQVLARKWRPRIFSEMVGQEHVVRALSNALDNDRLHHAYLFTGTRGVGKTTLARILSKSLNCEKGVSSTPCGECSACTEIDEGRFIDLLEVDAASRTKVDQTRELLENVPYAPVRGRYKVYLIDEVHMFSGGSFNALLKTLEEPPPHVKFLLATTDPQKVPVTVLSRCLQFNLKRLPFEQIRGQLKKILEWEKLEFDLAALGLLTRGADGSMRDALSLMDQAIAFGGGRVMEPDVRAMLGAINLERVHDISLALSDGDAGGVMSQVSALAEQAPDFAGVLQDLLGLLHRVALVQAVPEALDDNSGDLEQVRALADKMVPEDVQLFYQIGLIGQRDLPLAPDPRAGFEMVLLRMLAFRPGAPNQSSTLRAGSRKRTQPAAEEKKTAESGGARPESPVKSPGSRKPAAGAEVDLEKWHEVVESMDLGGIARQLANNCVYRSWDGRTLQLQLDPTHRHLQVGSSQQRLRLALQDLLDADVKLVIEAEAAQVDTPAMRQARTREERQREAESEMAADPLVKTMEERFGARLIPESVKPVDSTGSGK